MNFLNLGTTVINLDKVIWFEVSRLVKVTDSFHEYDDYGHKVDRNKKAVNITMEGDRLFSSTKPEIVTLFEDLAKQAETDAVLQKRN